MREVLANLIAEKAEEDSNFIVLSGDHGYALFDPIRKRRPSQFVNVGVCEQLAVSLSAGLAKMKFRPLVYGLSSFIPLRVVEHIKLDVCFQSLPVVFLGDGAGLVYSTLGASHQSGEDLAALGALPNLRIYSPSDRYELAISFKEAFTESTPAYIRIGKSDRAACHTSELSSTNPHTIVHSDNRRKLLIATGSLLSPVSQMAKKRNLHCISVPRLRPISKSFVQEILKFEEIFIFEEHSSHGGLCTFITNAIISAGERLPLIHHFSLKSIFTKLAGSYQFALSEHDLSDAQLDNRLSEILDAPRSTQAASHLPHDSLKNDSAEFLK
ncbi:MAG: transketolase [Bacteriovoracaceae bacterium]|nr:transketolase [Bacteriovoracaceae bacterium]